MGAWPDRVGCRQFARRRVLWVVLALALGIASVGLGAALGVAPGQASTSVPVLPAASSSVAAGSSVQRTLRRVSASESFEVVEAEPVPEFDLWSGRWKLFLSSGAFTVDDLTAVITLRRVEGGWSGKGSVFNDRGVAIAAVDLSNLQEGRKKAKFVLTGQYTSTDKQTQTKRSFDENGEPILDETGEPVLVVVPKRAKSIGEAGDIEISLSPTFASRGILVFTAKKVKPSICESCEGRSRFDTSRTSRTKARLGLTTALDGEVAVAPAGLTRTVAPEQKLAFVVEATVTNTGLAGVPSGRAALLVTTKTGKKRKSLKISGVTPLSKHVTRCVPAKKVKTVRLAKGRSGFLCRLKALGPLHKHNGKTIASPEAKVAAKVRSPGLAGGTHKVLLTVISLGKGNQRNQPKLIGKRVSTLKVKAKLNPLTDALCPATVVDEALGELVFERANVAARAGFRPTTLMDCIYTFRSDKSDPAPFELHSGYVVVQVNTDLDLPFIWCGNEGALPESWARGTTHDLIVFVRPDVVNRAQVQQGVLKDAQEANVAVACTTARR
jgi:hypothetical protein